MNLVKPNWRWLAIPVSLAFVYGGLRVLLGPTLMQPDAWQDYHILTMLTVAGTVGAGHLSGIAWRSSRYLAVLGFAVLFVTGTVLVVRQSMNRQAETATASTLAAADINDRILDKRADLKDAKARLAYAEDQIVKESTGQKCGSRCERWTRTAADRRVVVASIEADIAALGPQKPVNAGAEHLASLAGFFGHPREKVIALDTLFTPLLVALFFELGSVVSLGFAFRHRASVPPTFASHDELTAIRDAFFATHDNPSPPKPGKRVMDRLPANVVELKRHPVVEALERNGGEVGSNRELAKLMSVCDGEASKRVREIADRLEVAKIGKQVRIRLRA